jgi:hypothetical protein
MANEPVVIDFTPPSVRRAQKHGGSTFRGQVENITLRQVDWENMVSLMRGLEPKRKGETNAFNVLQEV